MRIPPAIRFLGLVALLVLIFGSCGSLTLGALDKAQTAAAGSLVDPTFLAARVGHFLQVLASVLTTATDQNGNPLRQYFFLGLALTVTFCFIAMPLAIVLGFVLALLSRSQLSVLTVPARAYVEFFRNTPLLVQLLAIWWGLAFLPHWLITPFTAGVATLTLNYAAYECENIRAGLAAVDRGQGEAAAALGLSNTQALRLVVVPQTISIVLPPVLNDFIYMFKDSAALTVVTIAELTTQSTGLGRRIPTLSWQFIIVGGLIYLAMSLPLGRLARAAEARLKSSNYSTRRDLTVTTAQVLAASVVVGLGAAFVADALSPDVVPAPLGQLLAAVGLTLTIMVFVLVVLGGIAYIPFSLLGPRRRAAHQDTLAQGRDPVALASK